jgi:hypothetical protein
MFDAFINHNQCRVAALVLFMGKLLLAFVSEQRDLEKKNTEYRIQRL